MAMNAKIKLNLFTQAFKTRMQGQGGFSLLELLAAVVILSIGLLATAGMQGIAINSNSLANRLTAATAIGQQVMEELLSRNANDPTLNVSATGIVYDLDPGDLAVTALSVPGAGTFSASISTTINTPVVGVTRITVLVTRDGGAQNVQLMSYKRVL